MLCRFYGSRYDDVRNFNANVSSDTDGEWNDTLGLVSHQLAALASLIAEVSAFPFVSYWQKQELCV